MNSVSDTHFLRPGNSVSDTDFYPVDSIGREWRGNSVSDTELRPAG